MLLRSLLIGLISGARSLTPIAVVANAAKYGQLPRGNGAPLFLGSAPVRAATSALAVGEVLGDKMKSAPDRIVLAGLIARVITGAVAASALAPRRQRKAAMALGAIGAIAGSYPTFHLRMKALRRFGQTSTGLVEDAITLGLATAVVHGGRGRDTGATLR